MKHIASVYVFQNGMVMVFDQHGEQMPEYQGTWQECFPAIIRDAPPDTVCLLNAMWRG